MPFPPPPINHCCNTYGLTLHTVIQYDVHYKPGDIDCRKGEGKIPKCLDSFFQVYIHSVFTCASTNDNAMFKLNWLIQV